MREAISMHSQRRDMYPLHTQDTMRNLADHLFDSSTGYAIGELSP
jgi:hypothetical protein